MLNISINSILYNLVSIIFYLSIIVEYFNSKLFAYFSVNLKKKLLKEYIHISK